MNQAALEKLRSASESIGTWLSIGSPVIAELAADFGFDWLLFDLEHGCGSEAGLLGNLQAIRGTKAAAIVRVGAPHPDLILRVLDWGAEGIMVPHVSSAADAERCVRAANYPPIGARGFSRSARTYGYGSRPPPSPPAAPFVMVQIETMEGVKNAREIAGVEGVDALFVGPSDLRFDLKQRGKPADQFTECIKQVAEASKAANKPWGILMRNDEEIPLFRDRGAAILAIDSDLGILRTRYQAILSQK